MEYLALPDLGVIVGEYAGHVPIGGHVNDVAGNGFHSTDHGNDRIVGMGGVLTTKAAADYLDRNDGRGALSALWCESGHSQNYSTIPGIGVFCRLAIRR